MIHLEVVGSSASPRADNLISRLGLVDSRSGARVSSPSGIYTPSTPTRRDARGVGIFRIPSSRLKSGTVRER
jgi:hypothetical protein